MGIGKKAGFFHPAAYLFLFISTAPQTTPLISQVAPLTSKEYPPTDLPRPPIFDKANQIASPHAGQTKRHPELQEYRMLMEKLCSILLALD